MLTPTEIILRLQNCLPFLTDYFHDELPVTSGSVINGILTITFPSAHGLTVGQQIFINNALIRNRLDTAELTADSTVRFTTNAEHDLTAYTSSTTPGTYPAGLSVIVEYPITGQETLLLDPTEAGVPGSYAFEAKEGTAVPTITGEEYLLEDRAIGVKGAQLIDTVPTTTTITIDLSNVPSVPNGDLVISNIITRPRIAMVADQPRAEALYTKQNSNDAYLFLILADRVPSKSRLNDDDLISLPGSGEKQLSIRQPFSTLVILPTNNDLGAVEAKDFAYDDLFAILSTCLYGWRETGYAGDGQASYNTSYYAHIYDWETRALINYTDGYQNTETVALRDQGFTQTPYLGDL
jgi:hypothetical protein